MKKTLCFILIFIFIITAAGCAAGQTDTTGTETEEEINAGTPVVGASLATFSLAAPSSSVLNSASNLAKSLGGELLYCGTMSFPGMNVTAMNMNFTVAEAKEGDNIVVYQLQTDKWTELTVTSITRGHVAVNVSQLGPVAFIRLPRS